ncbi:MAG: hypothetical protein WCF26_20725 [Candidatus Sulfotelmatobacter sp.]
MLVKLLKAKKKREEEEAAKRSAARIARKVRREQSQASGLDDLPLEVAVAMEENPAQHKEPAPVEADDSIASLVARLTAIRERIWRLQSVFAVSLSMETAIEANRYLQLFQELAAQLREKDPSALESLTVGQESLLLSPPIPLKQSIPLSTQRLVEMRWQAMTQPTQRAPKHPPGYVPDGLQGFV